MTDTSAPYEPFIPPELSVIADQIKRHETPPKISVRQLLQYFGFQRRGFIKVFIVQEALKTLGISTTPEFTDIWIDAEIGFISRVGGSPSIEGGAEHSGGEPAAGATEDPLMNVAAGSSDPTFRIGILPPANQPIVSVKPDDDINTAISRMLHNDFSQLPIMRNDYDVKGIISWTSIGSRMALRQPCETVRECMEARVEIVPAIRSIFSVIPLIVEHGYVLVKANNGKINGIVTASDLSLQFQQLAGPFLLLREIEQHIRKLINGRFSMDELRGALDPEDKREIKGVNDLTLGEYVRIFQNPELWDRLGLKGLSRSEFSSILDQIRLVRNDIMHFDPDPLGPEDLTKLTNFARFLQRLQDLRTC